MSRHAEPAVFHRFRCPHCEGIHYEHERSARSFAGYIAKHLSRCGKPQEARHVDVEYALSKIVTREVGALHVPEDWDDKRPAALAALAAKFNLKATAH